TFAGQTANFLEQILAQGAADAAVAHLHQLFLGAVEADAALHLAAIDVDLAHVVDDHRDAAVLAVLQDMVEQGALAGAEEAGQYGNGKALHGILSGFRVCLSRCSWRSFASMDSVVVGRSSRRFRPIGSPVSRHQPYSP